jgi:hypothetical protein
MRPIRIPQFLLLLCLLLGATEDNDVGPQYTAAGALLLPAGYREWVFMSAGLDMSYSAGMSMDHSMFDNVFVDPAAWASFKRTGHWPDRAMLVTEARGASSKGSINKAGHFQSDEVMAIEVHVHDEARFTGGWGFFVFGGTETKPAVLLPATADCYACHKAHGAVDTTFTQFYPTAKAIAIAKGTFHAD